MVGWSNEQKQLLDEICRKALEKWGWDEQKLVLIEELIEFAQALLHFDRGKIDIEELFGECVDVEIMMKQFKIHWGEDIYRTRFLRQKRIKLNELEGIVNE